MVLILDIQSKGNTPLVVQIQEQLRGKIRSGELPPGQKMPSMRELADQCGVSLGIVKQAINTLTLEGYMRAEPRSGVYVADPHKPHLADVALVLPTLNLPQMAQILAGVKQGLGDSGMRLFVQTADSDFDREADLVESLQPDKIAGAIIYPPPFDQFGQVLLSLRRRGVPVVLVDTALQALEVDNVTVERLEMGRLAMRQLVDRGHRRIGLVDHDGTSLSVRQIRQGWAEELARIGLNMLDMPRAVVSANRLDLVEPWAQGREAAIDLIKAHPDLTALIGINDNIGMGAFLAVKALGMRVPDDVSVMVADDMPAFATCHPPLSGIRQHHQEIGRLAAKRLLEITRDAKDGSDEAKADLIPQSIRLTPQLVLRQSIRDLTVG